MLIDQLKAYCDCMSEITEKDVFDLVSVVSLATGWMQEPCETFELSERREVIDLPSCMDCPYTFEPFYQPYDPDSFTFELLKVKGLEEEVTSANFVYSEYEKVFRVDTGLPKCLCACDECGCPTEYKLIVKYTAGYEELPECVLPVFCNLIEVIHEKNSCDCGTCGDCGGDEAHYDKYGNLITNIVKYKSGDVTSVFLETDLAKMLVQQYKNQLGTLSLYKADHNVWGYVV